MKHLQEAPRVEVQQNQLDAMERNLKKFITSEHVQKMFEVEDDMQDEVPDTKEVIEFRDNLISYLIIMNLRCSKEFTTFNLGELRSAARSRDGSYIIKISQHKTQRFGKYLHICLG